ncbi:MAG: hypothetical protein R2733_15815 [Acidimicrobiales bacterium]
MSDFSPPSGPPSYDSSPTGGIGPADHPVIDVAPGSDMEPGGVERRGGALKWLVGLGIVLAGVAALLFSQDPNDGNAALQLQSSAETPSTTSADEPEGSTAPTESTTTVPDDTASSTTTTADAASTTQPSTTVGEVEGNGQTAAVSIEGPPLSPMPNVGGPTTPDVDPSIGQVAPTLVGTDFDGNESTIGPDGRMKAVYFLAHWCPHCQVEVPKIQALIDAGVQPGELDIYGVSTAVAAERGNYPPQAWFEAEAWSSPLLRDDADASALVSYGAGGFPYVVFLDGENRLLTRAAGEMPPELIQQVWEIIAEAS